MPDLPTQNININIGNSGAKKSPWPMSFLEASSDGYVYSEWELEEIKKRAKAKFAEVGAQAAGSDKFIKDGSFVEGVVNARYMPGIVSEVKDKFQKAALEYERKLAEDAKKAAETKPASAQEKSFTIDEAKTYLQTNSKGSVASSMLPQIRGASDGKSAKSVKLLGNGLVIIKYDDIKEFESHVANAKNQAMYSDMITSLTGAKFKTLASVVEISSYGKDSSYKVVSSDCDGVRVMDISKKAYESLINDKSFASDKSLTEAQKAGNRDVFLNRIMREVIPARTSMDAGMKKFLLNQCRNDDLFGIVPVPGIIGGRKDRLKAAIRNSGFTFSKEDGVVVERDNILPNRVIVTINGESNQDTLIPLAHGCAVKVNKDGKIIPDMIFKINKDGSEKAIDISGGIFRLPLSFTGRLVSALRLDANSSAQAREYAREVMSKFKNLELVVCKDGEKRQENIGLSFMVLGKTHGLRLTDGEKIATTVSAGALTVGLGVVTAGIVPATTIAATTTPILFAKAAAAGMATALSGAATIKSSVDICDDGSVDRKINDLVTPNRGAQRVKSESFQNLTSNQRGS